MKKIYLLMATIILILSGCGGGGGNDAEDNGPPPIAKVGTSVVSFMESPSKDGFSTVVKMTAVQMAEDIRIELANFSVSMVNGCTIDSYTINGSSDTLLRFDAVGEARNVSIDARYSCTSSRSVSARDVQVEYDKWILNEDGSNRRGPYREAVNLGNPDNGEDGEDGGASYRLYPQESVTITNSEEHQRISVALSVTDVNGTHPAVDEKIVANFLQPIYGSLQSYTVTTDESGNAIFDYIPPKNIRGLSDSYISFYREGNPAKTEKTKLVFDPQLEEGAASLYIMPQIVQVSNPGEEQKIKFITVNSKNVGVSAELEIEQLYNGDGNDYGQLSSTHVKTDDSGVGEITYTAPASIANQPARVITVTEIGENLQQNLTFNFFSPEEGVLTYEVEAATPKTIAVDQNGTIVVTIHEKGAPDKLIDAERVRNVTVSIAGFENMLSFSKSTGNEFSYSEENTMSVGIETKTIAGVALVQIDATVFNGKEDVHIETVAPLTIMSGPISSLSLVYVKTIPDNDKGLYKDIYTVHAVDKYANHANAGDKIHPTLISGGTGTDSTEAATIMPDGTDSGGIENSGGTTLFVDSVRKPFSNLDPDRDRLVVLASVSHSSKEYMGHWSIDSIDSSESLALKEVYYGKKVNTGLKYVIGDEDRLLNSNVATADVVGSADNPNYVIDDNGTAQIEVVYDPALVGHTYTIAVNSYTSDSRSGAAIINNFRGRGYSCDDVTVPADGGSYDALLGIAILNPNEGTVWLDNVDIVPRSITVEPKKQCSIDIGNSDLHVVSGRIRVRVNTVAGDKDSCTIHWIPGNGSIFMEYF
jgi:hypothetical protein